MPSLGPPSGSSPPPEHVRAAFGVREEKADPLDQGPVWRCGEVVLKRVASTAEAAWIAQALDGLHVDDVRVSRPLRSTDGRWAVSGWAASRYVSGRVEPRHDAVVGVAQRLHAATAHLARPGFLSGRSDMYAVADAAA